MRRRACSFPRADGSWNLNGRQRGSRARPRRQQPAGPLRSGPLRSGPLPGDPIRDERLQRRALVRLGAAGHRVVAALPAHPPPPGRRRDGPLLLANGHSRTARNSYALYYGMITLRYTSVMSGSLGVRNNFLRFTVKLCESLRGYVM